MNDELRNVEFRHRNLMKECSPWHPLYLQLKFASECVRKYFEEIESGILCDFGCGDKPYQIYCSDKVKYIGIDIDLKNIHADIFSSVYSVPLPDCYSDYNVSFFVLEHVDEPQIKINEMYRILKKEGKLFMLVPLYWEEHECPYDFFRYTRYGIEYLLKKAGFKEIEISPINGASSIIGINLIKKINSFFIFKPLVPLLNIFFYFLDRRYTRKETHNVMTFMVSAKK